MALTYAARLKKGVDYGVCGLPETIDSTRIYEKKLKELVQTVKNAKHLVIYTGAGISTSCGIPDFRGPNGVWTKEQEEEGIIKPKKGTSKSDIKSQDLDAKSEISWENANPSLTHMAILGLLNAGKLKFLISQNVDGLHIKSGFPRDKIAELHGNVFKETCDDCNAIYIRNFDIQGIGLKPTGRRCDDAKCNGILRDSLLDWDNALPEDQLDLADIHTEKADVAFCLGTSLRVRPASEMPLEVSKSGGKLVIVNLQKTPKDQKASIKIHEKCDVVMKDLMKGLGIPIPVYKLTQKVAITTTKSQTSSTERVLSICTEDMKTSIPYISYVEVNCNNEVYLLVESPFEQKVSLKELSGEISIKITLHFVNKCTAKKHEVDHVLNTNEDHSSQIVTMETVYLDYNEPEEDSESSEEEKLKKKPKRKYVKRKQ